MQVKEIKIKVYTKDQVNLKANEKVQAKGMELVVEENGVCTLVFDNKPIIKDLTVSDMLSTVKKLYQFVKDCDNRGGSDGK